MENNFQGHYEEWRQRRFEFLIDHYSTDFFRGKTLLELGGGHGDLGAMFAGIGAHVTTVEARSEHIAVGKERYPEITFIQRNLEEDFTDLGIFDIVLHVGLLYHLSNVDDHLRSVAAVTGETLILETEVCDSDNPFLNISVRENENGYDQSYIGGGSRPSPAYVERVLESLDLTPKMIATPALNAEFHRYDWPIGNLTSHAFGQWEHGLRRFWLCEKREDTAHLVETPQATGSNVSFVVQGAISRSREVSTRDVCKSIRKHFPGAEIVLSTWPDQDVSGIDHDILVLSDDPGALPYHFVQNTNRQIVGCIAGIRQATRPLVMKTRTDIIFHSGAVLEYWERWTERCADLKLFESRVLTPNVFARKPSLLAPLPLHPSDWCFFGRKSDLELLYDLPLLKKEECIKNVGQNTQVIHYSPEQYLWLGALRKKIPNIPWSSSWHVTPELLRLTEKSIANNLAILDAYEQFGISCPKYSAANRAFRDFTLYQHEDWLEIYERCCLAKDKTTPAPLHDMLKNDFAQWSLNDERLLKLRRAGYSWEAQLVECVIIGPTIQRDSTTGGQSGRQELDAAIARSAAETLHKALAASRLAAETLSTSRIKRGRQTLDRLSLEGDQINAYPPGRHVLFQARPAKVTVCVPIYNAGTVLRRCIDSILTQHYADFQLKIVDNGSTDGTYEACRDYADANEHVLLYQNARNIGRVPNWNRCFDLATGEYVKLVLVNDYLMPDALEKLALTMDRYPSVALARCGLYFLGADGATHFVPRMQNSMVLPSQIAREMGMALHNICDTPSAQMLRRASVIAGGIRYDTQFQWSADFEFAQRALQCGDFAYVLEAGAVMDMTVQRFATGAHDMLQYTEDIAVVLRTYNALGARPDQAQSVIDRLQRERDGQISRNPSQGAAIERTFIEALQQVKQSLLARAA